MEDLHLHEKKHQFPADILPINYNLVTTAFNFILFLHFPLFPLHVSRNEAFNISEGQGEPQVPSASVSQRNHRPLCCFSGRKNHLSFLLWPFLLEQLIKHQNHAKCEFFIKCVLACCTWDVTLIIYLDIHKSKQLEAS